MPFLLFFVGFVSLRLVFWGMTFPNPDEAYYWLWGQHPAWSYYDHPPFQAWIQGLFTTILGRSTFSLRLPNLISNGIFFYTYYQITRYLYGNKAWRYFWLLLLLLLASPLYFLFLALAWPDHWLITLSLGAAFLFITFLDGYIATGKGDDWRIYAAAVLLGLAGLCKYNAVFVALGFAATLAADKRLRPLWRDRRLYGAIAIALTALIPILLWNLSNDFQSFRYYVDRSVSPGSFSLKLAPCLNFLLFSVLTVSPLHGIGFLRSWRQSPAPHLSVYRSVAYWTFAGSTLILTVISLLSAALYYWNITAYLLLFPLLPAVFLPEDATEVNQKLAPVAHPRLFWAGQLYGLFFATVLVVHYSFLPLSALISRDADPDSRMLFGWEQVATVAENQAAELQQPFWVTTDYRSASALAYQRADRTVTALSDRVDQFDFWFAGAALKGKDAVILADDWHPIQPALLAQFNRTSAPITIPVWRFGVWIKNYYLLKGYGFNGKS